MAQKRKEEKTCTHKNMLSVFVKFAKTQMQNDLKRTRAVQQHAMLTF